MIERRLAEIHIIAAREKALRIFSYASTVYPGEWGKQYQEIIILDLQEFAYHARRINQLCDLERYQFPDVDRLLVKITESDPGDWEKNYKYALNRIAHIKKFVFGSAHADHRITFQNSDNLMPLYVKIETDNHDFATISIFGIVDCFLSAVIPEIVRKFPEFQF